MLTIKNKQNLIKCLNRSKKVEPNQSFFLALFEAESKNEFFGVRFTEKNKMKQARENHKGQTIQLGNEKITINEAMIELNSNLTLEVS